MRNSIRLKKIVGSSSADVIQAKFLLHLKCSNTLYIVYIWGSISRKQKTEIWSNGIVSGFVDVQLCGYDIGRSVGVRWRSQWSVCPYRKPCFYFRIFFLSKRCWYFHLVFILKNHSWNYTMRLLFIFYVT